MKYIINGRGGFIGIQVSGNKVICRLAWIDKFCPPTVDLDGVGTVEIPAHLTRQLASTIIPNLTLNILKSCVDSHLI